MISSALIEEVLPELGKCLTQVITYTNGYKVKRIYWPKFSLKAPWDTEVIHDPRKNISKV